MSDMKITFSDDRGKKLEHYGVKGMKWHQHLFGTHWLRDTSRWLTDTDVVRGTAQHIRYSKNRVRNTPAFSRWKSVDKMTGIMRTIGSTRMGIAMEKGRAALGARNLHRVLKKQRTWDRMRNTPGGKF